MYDLPKFDINKTKNKILKTFKNRTFQGVLLLVIACCIAGSYAYVAALRYFPAETQALLQYFKLPKSEEPKTNISEAQNFYKSDFSYEQAIINAAKNVSPSVVSIVISKNLPVYEQQWVSPFGDGSATDPFGGGSPWDLPNIQIPQQVQKGTKLQQVGAGSGFIVSPDGLVLTNKHVVSDDKADYTVLTNDGKKYSAKVLALDPVQDLAVIKIQLGKSDAPDTKFQAVTLGDSSGIQIGQTAITIGNALGQFSNTVSVGVVSGLQRTISASDQLGSFSETLEGIIQTDAAINAGNSGGPLLNLKGEVVGINTAMAQGAEAIGFAIPINRAKKDIEQVAKTNKIVYPFLGVRYVLVDNEVKQEYGLSVDYGALVLKGDKGEPAVTSGSPAQKAGIKAKDVILEINGEKITTENSMTTIIRKYNVGDKVTLHILRPASSSQGGNGEEQDIEVVLIERPV